MIDLNLMKRKNGHFSCEGEEYTLIEMAYIDGPVADPFFKALAIKDSDVLHPDEDDCIDVYKATWAILPDWDGEDGMWACDWEHPARVDHFTCGYDVEDGCCRG